MDSAKKTRSFPERETIKHRALTSFWLGFHRWNDTKGLPVDLTLSVKHVGSNPLAFSYTSASLFLYIGEKKQINRI